MTLIIHGNVINILSIALSQGVSVQGDVDQKANCAVIETDEPDELIDIVESTGGTWEKEEPELFESNRTNAPRIKSRKAPSSPKISWCKSKEKHRKSYR